MDRISELAKEGPEVFAGQASADPVSPEKVSAMVSAIQVDGAKISRHVDEVVRGTVQETLNALLNAEADRLCQAGRDA